MDWLISIGITAYIAVVIGYAAGFTHAFSSDRWVSFFVYAHACLAVVSLALMFFFYQSIGFLPFLASSIWLFLYREERRKWLKDLANPYLYKTGKIPSFGSKNDGLLSLGMMILGLSGGYYLLELIGILFH